MANQFGGEWTEIKIRVFKKYLHAYMQIMKNKPWKLIYFDGFAGSGEIKTKDTEELIEGTAKHVLKIKEPKEFDLYYFVEKNIDHASYLQKIINSEFSKKKARCKVQGGIDCNTKLLDMANFLKSVDGKNFKVVAFLDPYGMQIEWPSIEVLKRLGVDLWILVPTGIAVNRILKKNKKPDQSWFNTLGNFFGLNPKDIEERFYQDDPQQDFFMHKHKKIDNAVDVAANLYKERLNTIFKFVSNPLPLRNSTNAVLFHFIAASNAAVAMKIANDIIKQEL